MKQAIKNDILNILIVIKSSEKIKSIKLKRVKIKTLKIKIQINKNTSIFKYLVYIRLNGLRLIKK